MSQLRRTVPSLQSFGVLTLLSVLIAGPAFLIIHLLEPGLILPALSILLFSYAAIVAIAAYSIHADWNSENVTLWNISGAFTMMGCATAILSEPDQVAQFFEPLAEQHLDAPRQETVRPAPFGS
jgi:hypothetical protein